MFNKITEWKFDSEKSDGKFPIFEPEEFSVRFNK
jgi:hypothetical protein